MTPEEAQAAARRLQHEAEAEALRQLQRLRAGEEQRLQHLASGKQRARDSELQEQLLEERWELERLDAWLVTLEAEAEESAELGRRADEEERGFEEELKSSSWRCEELQLKLQEPRLSELQMEVHLAEENVAMQAAAFQAAQESPRRDRQEVPWRSEEKHRAAQLRQECLEQEAGHGQRCHEQLLRAEAEASRSLAAWRQRSLQALEDVRAEAEKESSDFRRLAAALRAELAQPAPAPASTERLAAELRRRRQAELELAAHVEELKSEVASLQERAAVEAEPPLEPRAPLREALREELEHFRSEAAAHFGLPWSLPPGSIGGEEAAAQFCYAKKLAELAESSQDGHAKEKLRQLKQEVHRLRLERQRLVDISNDLRAELREEPAARLPVQERRSLLEAALRALVSENRQLQSELSSQDRELPSSSAFRPRLAEHEARKDAKEDEGLLGEGDLGLLLQGTAPARSSSSGLPSGGYLRQPLSEDTRLPRSASDRGTESQRKALERLRAVQAKHDQAAKAAAEQRQKVLPLIRWRDAATAASRSE